MAIIFIMLKISLQINLLLAFFNLLPIPPLDGSKIFAGILPNRYANQIYMIESKGPMILFGVIIFGMVTGIHIIGMVIYPFVNIFAHLFAGV